MILHVTAILAAGDVYQYVDPLLLAGSISSSSNPWFDTPPTLNFSSNGSNGTRTQPTSLFAAPLSPSAARNGSAGAPYLLGDLADAGVVLPGDVVWLRGGVYGGHFVLPGGTEEAPVLFRTVPTERAVIHGTLEMRGDWAWLWGVEIADPANFGSNGKSSLVIAADDVRIVNCVIRDTVEGNGILTLASAHGDVYYGNVLYNTGASTGHVAHGIFAQNTPRNDTANDRKYFIENKILDSGGSNCDGDATCYTFYGYADPEPEDFDQVQASGMWLEGNVFAGGTALVGGRGPPSVDVTFDSNIAVNARLKIGYRQPTQAWVHSNKVFGSYIDALLWGAGEAAYQYPSLESRIEFNQVYNPPADTTDIRYGIKVRSAAYLDKYRPGDDTEVTPDFREGDVVNYNFYSPDTLKFSVAAGGTVKDELTFAQYQDAATAAGLESAGSSSQISPAAADDVEVHIMENTYDSSLVHIFVVNHAGADVVKSVNVRFSKLGVANGHRYELFDTYALHSGAYGSGGNELDSWPPPSLVAGTATSVGSLTIPLDRATTTQRRGDGYYTLWTVWIDRWRPGEDFPIDVPELRNDPALYPTGHYTTNNGADCRFSTLSVVLATVAAVGAV